MPQVIIPYQSSHTKGGCITVFGPKNCSGFSGSNGTFIEYTFSANAFEFINETKEKEVENAKPQPTEITIIEKRSLRTKILLGIGIVVLSVALIGSFVYIGMQLYNYFA